jgi:hypothetical protein
MMARADIAKLVKAGEASMRANKAAQYVRGVAEAQVEIHEDEFLHVRKSTVYWAIKFAWLMLILCPAVAMLGIGFAQLFAADESLTLIWAFGAILTVYVWAYFHFVYNPRHGSQVN